MLDPFCKSLEFLGALQPYGTTRLAFCCLLSRQFPGLGERVSERMKMQNPAALLVSPASSTAMSWGNTAFLCSSKGQFTAPVLCFLRRGLSLECLSSPTFTPTTLSRTEWWKGVQWLLAALLGQCRYHVFGRNSSTSVVWSCFPGYSLGFIVLFFCGERLGESNTYAFLGSCWEILLNLSCSWQFLRVCVISSFCFHLFNNFWAPAKPRTQW